MTTNGFFVTGTDTGVGKTVVSTVFAVGLKAFYWKPVQSGTGEGSDSSFLRDWIGPERVLPEAVRLKAPLSPHAAAELEGVEIDFMSVISQFPETQTPLIVEGAGGLLVPINKKYLMIDLIKELSLPAVVATRSTLGTINHTLLTLEALRQRHIDIAGVVMVGEPNESNKDAIETYGNVRVLGRVPICSHFSRPWFQDTFQQLCFSGGIPCP